MVYIQQNGKSKVINHDQQLQLATSDYEIDSASTFRLLNRKRSHSASSLDQQNQPKVSFNKMTTSLAIPHIDDIEKDIIDAQWLSEEEMRDIKDMATEIALFMTNNNGEQVIDDTDGYCYRGLEYRTVEGNRNSRRNKSIVREAVIVQQQMYGVGGNPGRVAFASMSNSMISRMQAVERAKLDELFAQEYLEK